MGERLVVTQRLAAGPCASFCSFVAWEAKRRREVRLLSVLNSSNRLDSPRAQP